MIFWNQNWSSGLSKCSFEKPTEMTSVRVGILSAQSLDKLIKFFEKTCSLQNVAHDTRKAVLTTLPESFSQNPLSYWWKTDEWKI